MRRDPSVQDLHHSDIITYALTRLAGQYAREKVEILRDLRNFRAAESPSLRMGGQENPGPQLVCLQPPNSTSEEPSSRAVT